MWASVRECHSRLQPAVLLLGIARRGHSDRMMVLAPPAPRVSSGMSACRSWAVEAQ